jgi:rod shape-determining protein MreB
MICIPYGVTEVERRAVEDATFEAGAKSVALIEEPIASAIGSGLKIAGARGSMIVDIGGGTTEVAVISLGGIVISHSLRTAGNVLDESIVQYMKREHKILIGDGTAEALKKDIGSVHSSMDRGEREIRGRNLRTGLPAVMTITSAQVREAMRESVDQIIDTIKMALENTPPELSADIFDFGIMLAGGGALLGGLPALITERTGVRVTVAKRPLDSVALGIGRVIEGNYSGVAKYRAR